jgi:hypothetical protein
MLKYQELEISLKKSKEKERCKKTVQETGLQSKLLWPSLK